MVSLRAQVTSKASREMSCARASLPCRGWRGSAHQPRCSGRGPDHRDGLVEVETVQVGAMVPTPRAVNQMPTTASSQEEVKAAAVVGCALEDQATEVTVGSHDVVGLFLLAKLVAVVLGLGLGGFTHQGGGHQELHGGEQGSIEDTCDAHHVEGASGCCARPGTPA